GAAVAAAKAITSKRALLVNGASQGLRGMIQPKLWKEHLTKLPKTCQPNPVLVTEGASLRVRSQASEARRGSVGSMEVACSHCGAQHSLKDAEVSKHPKVKFRCSKCGESTVVETKRRVDQTMVISPLPSFARGNASASAMRLAPEDT